MDKRQGFEVTALEAAQIWLDDNNAFLGAVNASLVRKDFDQIIEGLHEAIADQARTARRGEVETVLVRDCRRTLMDRHVRPVFALIDTVRERNAILEVLKLPPAALSSKQLVQATASLAEECEKHEKLLLELGARPGFVQRMRNAAEALDAALRDGSVVRIARKAATHQIKEGLAKARVQVRALTSLIREHAADNPQLEQAWRAKTLFPTHRPLALGAGSGARALLASGSTDSDDSTPAASTPAA